MARVKVKQAGGTPPPPIDFDALLAVDEGPMRGDLKRQIALLERELTRVKAIVAPWELDRANAARGPALLDSETLERIRDELLNAVRALRDRYRADQPRR
jgi:hypothetical protein